MEAYADDIVALVTEIRDGRLPDPLRTMADPSRTALAGHSTGGGAAVLAAMETEGVAGVLGLDAWVEPLKEHIDAGLVIPQLHLGSQQWRGGFSEPWLRRLGLASEPWASYRIEGSAHTDFTMIRYITSIASLVGWAGKVNGERFASIATGVSSSWLMALLKDGPQAAVAAL
ncbi:MAG: hypothetical protein E4H20_04375, partial [Spirochaetales bacterium]